ncbi:MAG: orotate phosphoribosyltransferase [Actinomycetota bacterium]
MNEEEVLEVLKKTGAVRKGHFKLTSGLHADTYYQCALLLANPGLTERMGDEIAKAFAGQDIDLVVSPALGGLVLGFATALSLGKRFIWAERENGVMTFRRGFEVEPGQRILVVEDVVTTGGSVEEVIKLTKEAGGEVAGIACLLNRGGREKIDGLPVKAMATVLTKAYEPTACPLCKAGEPIESPGSRRN